MRLLPITRQCIPTVPEGFPAGTASLLPHDLVGILTGMVSRIYGADGTRISLQFETTPEVPCTLSGPKLTMGTGYGQ